MKTLKTIKQKLLADAKTRAAYDAMADEFSVAKTLIAARARAGLSQAEVAQRMGTTQSAIARLESGRLMPTWQTIARYAAALGGRAVLKIETVN
jgi:DNA-binding XRE family transcriptional regulator